MSERAIHDAPEPNAEFDAYAEGYRALLDQSVAASGESGEYFARYKANYAAAVLGSRFAGSILDYGCGVGLLTSCLLRTFAQARVFGYDPSPASIRMAAQSASGAQLTAVTEELPEKLDAILVANVLHHVPPAERQTMISTLAARLSPAGRLFLFEHNPLNPVTREAVRRCVFDRDAILLRPKEVLDYVRHAQLAVLRHDYIVFFPRMLKWLRPMERMFARCPLGAQYVVVSAADVRPLRGER